MAATVEERVWNAVLDFASGRKQRLACRAREAVILLVRADQDRGLVLSCPGAFAIGLLTVRAERLAASCANNQADGYARGGGSAKTPSTRDATTACSRRSPADSRAGQTGRGGYPGLEPGGTPGAESDEAGAVHARPHAHQLGRLSSTDLDHVRLAIATIFGMSPGPTATSRTPTTLA